MRNKIVGLTVFLLFFQDAFAQTTTFVDSNLPIVKIYTQGATIVDEPKVTASMKIVYNGTGVRNEVAGPFTHYDGFIGIEIRGSSSQSYPKKGYGIELRDGLGEDLNFSLLGMPKERDWVLVAPYNDKTLMRDALAYNLAARIQDYAPRCRFVELFLNDQYQGVYLLTEKIKRDKDRVDIHKTDPDDVTGGYIFKLDKNSGSTTYRWDSPYLNSFAPANQANYYEIAYPKFTDLTWAQVEYLEDWFSNIEDKFASPQYQDPIEGYLPWIDMASFVDYALIQEAFRNVDGYRISTYYTKDSDVNGGKLRMGPVWDFNISMGIGDFCGANLVNGWQYNYLNFCPLGDYYIPFYWEKLKDDPNYILAERMRWNQMRSNVCSDANVNFMIDSLQAELTEAQVRNFQKWPIFGTYVWPNAFIGQNYQSEVDYLRNWLLDRFEWIDGQLPPIPSSVEEPIYIGGCQAVPNPVLHEIFNIRYDTELKSSELRLSIYDSDGRLISTQRVSDWIDISQINWLSPPKNGVFTYELLLDNKIVCSNKLLRM